MKRNTAIALAYWLMLAAVIVAAGSVEETNQPVFIGLGLAYMLLSWSPLLIVKFVERRPIASLGLRLKSPLRTVLWGMGAFILVTALSMGEAWYRVFFQGETLGAVAPPISNWPFELLAQLLWIGFPEEIVNRGYLLTRLKESWGVWPALFISSFLFGAIHLGMGNVPLAIQAGVSGLVLGWAFLATENVYAPALAHILNNLFDSAIVRAILSR